MSRSFQHVRSKSANFSRHFDRAALPVAEVFYEREIGALSKPSRGWAKANCPFHASESKKSFAINLDSGGFFCFSCGARGGDVLAFVRKRRNLDFKQAAIELGCWGSAPTPQQVQEIAERKRKAEQRQAELAAKEEAERRARFEARNHHLALERVFQVVNSRLTRDMDPAEQELYFELLADLTDEIREADARYCALAGLECR